MRTYRWLTDAIGREHLVALEGALVYFYGSPEPDVLHVDTAGRWHLRARNGTTTVWTPGPAVEPPEQRPEGAQRRVDVSQEQGHYYLTIREYEDHRADVIRALEDFERERARTRAHLAELNDSIAELRVGTAKLGARLDRMKTG